MYSILVIEDNKDTQFLISTILRFEGYDTITVDNGYSALEQVKKNLPDMILSDIGLPGLNGLQVLEELKKINENILVIMMTANSNSEKEERAKELGAFEYIKKPFDNKKFISTIKHALEYKHQNFQCA
ncbi:MAG TPA: response regulator [Candidatus Cloacimonetes bacterium]|nr:response regulator [Candidatus Cloacimonadota bacterium]